MFIWLTTDRASIFHHLPVQDHWAPVGFPALELSRVQLTKLWKGQGNTTFPELSVYSEPGSHSPWLGLSDSYTSFPGSLQAQESLQAIICEMVLSQQSYRHSENALKTSKYLGDKN